ncbi:hypothetical protein [Vannielia litorea]|uniref:hypothetical protein n=1 Tax=Vannielia litorea TaxID=1217970 RepID=UPI0021BDE7AF|nr:hypothetical protein [Vannielia litorea]
MAIYFKEVEVPSGMEPGEEIKKVLDFRQKCIDEKKVFFKLFYDISEFKAVIRDKLEEIGWQETDILSPQIQQSTKSKKESGHNDSILDSASQDEWLIEDRAREFLSEIVQRPHSWGGTSPQEVARLRLIGNAISRSGNDDSYLGNHDANLIFQHMRNDPLSDQEIQALLDCGVFGFEHQNVPLWHWVAQHLVGDDTYYRLRILATVGTDAEKRNAIRILELLDQAIPTHDGYFNKDGVLTTWFDEDTDSRVFDAAVSFLAANGQSEDISFIETASSGCSPHRKNKVEGAIVGIISKFSANDALRRLCDRNVDKLDDRITDDLFSSPQSLSSEILKECLTAKPDPVRLRAAKLLSMRNELTREDAQAMLTDSSHEVRLTGSEVLARLGHPLNEETLKSVLTVKKSDFGVGLLRSMQNDTRFFEAYRSNRLSELTMSELRDRVDGPLLFVDRELSALYNKFGASMQDEMRTHLSDGFNGHFERKIEEAKLAYGVSDKVVLESEKLGPFHRKMLCNATIAALCNLMIREDLELIRTTIDQFEVDANESTLRYLSKFGEWQDIDRIKNLGNQPSDRTGLFFFSQEEITKQKANAIYSLGKLRISDMLDLDLDNQIRKYLLAEMPQKAFKSLSDDILLRELKRSHDESRIVFALRCVQSLTKSRTTSLLDQYTDSEEHRFYNSIHWLDLGAALPSTMAKSVAIRELSRRF